MSIDNVFDWMDYACENHFGKVLIFLLLITFALAWAVSTELNRLLG